MPRFCFAVRLFAVMFLSLSLCPALSAQQTDTDTQNSGGGSASDFQLDRPELVTDISEASEQMQSGFVGTNENEELFFGSSGTGENANSRANRNFNTRTQGQNVNQGQTQPLYRTFGTNNVPYRSPHLIAFEVPKADGRVVTLKMDRRLRSLSTQRPQFRNIQFILSESNTVTLKGSVASQSDKQLAYLYLKMEPGVDRVVNDLQIQTVNSQIPPTPSATQP